MTNVLVPLSAIPVAVSLDDAVTYTLQSFEDNSLTS